MTRGGLPCGPRPLQACTYIYARMRMMGSADSDYNRGEWFLYVLCPPPPDRSLCTFACTTTLAGASGPHPPPSVHACPTPHPTVDFTVDNTLGRPTEIFPTHVCEGAHPLAQIGLNNYDLETTG
jgi:hypothetical protein